MHSSSLQRTYYPELDVLRFVAFLLVFINHAPFLPHSSISKILHEYGWIGVDLFLCLSSFLITKLLLTEYQRTENIDVLSFYARRALRIWPLYFLFTFLTFVLTLANQGWDTAPVWNGLRFWTFSDNMAAAFFGYNHLLYSVHLWTISYEEQFYIVIPWLLIWFSGFTESQKLRFVALSLVAGNIVRAILIGLNVPHPAIYVLPITHFDSILAGILVGLGILDRRTSRIPPWFWITAGLLALGGVIMLPNTHETGWTLIATYSLAGIGAFCVLIAFLNVRSSPARDAAGWRPIVYLGRISYGLYVFHIGALTLANHINESFGLFPNHGNIYPVVMFILGLSITVVFAILSYHFLERPFLKLKERFTIIGSRPL